MTDSNNITLSGAQLDSIVGQVLAAVLHHTHAAHDTNLGHNVGPAPVPAANITAAQAPNVGGTASAPVAGPASAPAASGSAVANEFSTSEAPVQGPVCARCGFQLPAEPFYVVIVGKGVGIFSDPGFALSLVSGVSGGSFKKYASWSAAQQAYMTAIASKIVRIVTVG